jgi:hypothetical protein
MTLTDGIAWAALFVAAFAAIFAALQWKSAERSADAAERSAQAAEHAVRVQENSARAETANTAIALASAERSAVASEQSAASARSLFEIGERPWVSRKYTVAATQSLPEGGLKCDVVTELLNTGKTPAFNLVCRQAVQVLPEIPETVTYPNGPEVEPESVTTLGPGMSCKFSQTISLSPSQVTDVRANTTIMCVYGQSNYDDFLNVNHITQWFLKYMVTTNDFSIAARHNRMT